MSPIKILSVRLKLDFKQKKIYSKIKAILFTKKVLFDNVAGR